LNKLFIFSHILKFIFKNNMKNTQTINSIIHISIAFRTFNSNYYKHNLIIFQWVASIDLGNNDQADANILVQPADSWNDQVRIIISKQYIYSALLQPFLQKQTLIYFMILSGIVSS
jgi:hypothetical protein